MSLILVRKIAGISATELAKRSGVDPAVISRLDHGRHQLRASSFHNVAMLAAVFRLTADELLTVVEAPPLRFPIRPPSPPTRRRGRPRKDAAAQDAAR
jgi:transcriptional regulator with XRE-family HTH domain